MQPDRIVDAATFQEYANVSRETRDRLTRYADLLVKWQARVNLVGRKTLSEIWRRHMLDSWQILHHARAVHGAGVPDLWLDIGTGAGFPGLVLAICGAGKVHLVEADARKCAFLGQVVRHTEAPATIHRHRIEAMAPFPVPAICARACAPLDRLVSYAKPFLGPQSELWALKGRNVNKELDALAVKWRYNVDRYSSLSDPTGTVLRLTDLGQRDASRV